MTQSNRRNPTIAEAITRYLNERRSDVSDSTLYNHSSQLKQFRLWCDADEGRPEKVREIDGWNVSDFQMDRRDDDQLAETSLYNQMSSLRVFIRWCESRNLLEGVSENIIMPNVEDGTRDETLDSERGQELLKSLQKYEYASFDHVLFSILWTTGLRVGTVRALDVDDFHPDEMYLDIEHRPDSGTPLKNKSGAERQVNLHEWVVDVIDDYIEGRRESVTDGHGREPLLTTRNGRPHRNTLRKRVVAITRPCQFTNECPYDREIRECEATKYGKAASCPGSISPHPLRRSAITRFLNEGHSKELVSDRMDVSVDVLDEHYDARSKEEKRELRREMFDM